MEKRCIVNVSVHRQYPRYQVRLLESLKRVGYKGDILKWTDEYPKGCPLHKDAPYNLKPYSLIEAMDKGYTSILWMDSPDYAIRPIEPIFEELEKEGCFIVAGADKLSDYISDGALGYFGMKREDTKDMRLICGQIFGFNLGHPTAKQMLLDLMKCAKAGFFSGHWRNRGEEPPLSVLAYRSGLKLTPLGGSFQAGRRNEDPRAIVRSGRDKNWEPWDQIRLA